MLLVTSNFDWADEMDIKGAALYTIEEWADYVQLVSEKVRYPHTVYVGTNQEIELSNAKEALAGYIVRDLGEDSEAAVRIFNGREFGTFVELEADDEDEDEDEPVAPEDEDPYANLTWTQRILKAKSEADHAAKMLGIYKVTEPNSRTIAAAAVDHALAQDQLRYQAGLYTDKGHRVPDEDVIAIATDHVVTVRRAAEQLEPGTYARYKAYIELEFAEKAFAVVLEVLAKDNQK